DAHCVRRGARRHLPRRQLGASLLKTSTSFLQLRIEPNRLVEIGHRSIQVPRRTKDFAAVEISPRVARIELERLAQVRHGPIEVTFLSERKSAVAIGIGVTRIESDCLVQVVNRSPVLASYIIDITTIVER